MRLNPRIAPATVSVLALVGAGLVAVATPAHAADPAGATGKVVINEVSSNGFTSDFIELYNNGATNVDLTGYVLSDDKGFASAEKTVLDGVLPAGGYAVYQALPFGLGSADTPALFTPSGDVVDSYAYTAHRAPSAARIPDGTGTFTLADGTGSNPVPTPGGPNGLTTIEASISINEYASDGAADFIELRNSSSTAFDLAGWSLADGTTKTVGDEILFGAGASVPANGYLAIQTENPTALPTGVTYANGGFGLNKTDHVFLSNDEGAVVDTTWVGLEADGVTTRHAVPSWARVTPGTGLWKMSSTATAGQQNVFTPTTPEEPEVPATDPNWADVVINEISSDNADRSGNIFGAPLADAVELKNTGTQPVSIDGWKQVDSGAATAASDFSGSFRVDGTATTTIPAGGYGVFQSTKGLSSGGDAVKIYTPAGVLVDEVIYGAGDGGYDETNNTDHAYTSFAACADGSGEFWRVMVKSFGTDNTAACADKVPAGGTDSTIVINEVTNIGGRVELLNTGETADDISGVLFENAAGTIIHTVPASTSVAPGEFYYIGDLAGLGSVDTLRVTEPAGPVIDSFSWAEDGIASYQRCEAFGVISLSELPTATFGAANACPDLSSSPWPGSQQVEVVDEVDTFGDLDGNGDGDFSGVAFDPKDASILWAVQNKSRLYKLTKNAENGNYEPVAGWDDGKVLTSATETQPDTEGVTVAPDGSLYITSERDNAVSGDSSNVVLRYDVSSAGSATTLTATHSWDVNSDITTGANLGLEGITWIPDAALTAGGYLENDGSVYAPSDYPGHGSGLFVVAVEATGDLHAFALAPGAAPKLVATQSSGFPFSMDVTWDADRELLWALCDDGCGGAYNTLDLVDGEFEIAGSYARPAGMPNLNNEGLAIAPFSASSGDYQEVVWTDDGDTDGHSFRAGALWRTLDLTEPKPPVTETPAPPVVETPAPVVPTPVATEFATVPIVSLSTTKPKVGTSLRARIVQPTPAAETTTYRWTVDGKTVSTRDRFTPKAKHAGEKVTLSVTFAKAGLTTLTRTVVSAVIAPKATKTTLKYKKVAAGKSQKVTFSNLIPGKKYAVHYRGKKIETVKANANGNARLIFKAGTAKGAAKVTITVGSKRTGKQFSVR